MFTITIEKNTKLENIESYYDRLNDAKIADVSVDVSLPKELRNYYLGLVPSLLQFIVTWVRYSKAGNLLIDIDEPSESILDDLYKNELIFPAVVLVWNKTGVFTKNGINLRGKLNKKNREIRDRMLAGRALPGHKLLLTDFDHLSNDNLLPCFGDRYDFVPSRSQLRASIQQGLEEVFYYFSEIPYRFESGDNNFISIIYELMKNTFEWGKEDENQVPLDPNIRGTLVKFFKKKRESLIEDYGSHKGLKDFFNSEKIKENDSRELYFVEISVFDGGIGFARKYRSIDPTADSLTEIDIIKRCLVKHMTTAQGIDKGDKGLGLDEILFLLDGRGFLRIKSGQSCVYRNLITHPYLKTDTIDQIVLHDWKSHNDKNFTKFRESEGAVVTIIYPIAIDGSK